MARSQSKLSIYRVQPAHRPVKTGTITRTKPDPLWIEQQHKISRLRQFKNKTLKHLEFISAPDYKGISLSFQDGTCLDLKIETFFTVKADYFDGKTGKHRVLKRWPPQHPSQLLRR